MKINKIRDNRHQFPPKGPHQKGLYRPSAILNFPSRRTVRPEEPLCVKFGGGREWYKYGCYLPA